MLNSQPTHLTHLHTILPLLRRPRRDAGNPFPPDFEPGPIDVCSGRGKRNWNHPGNIAFRDLIQSNVYPYIHAETKNDKTAIVCRIVDDLRNEGCRFLQKNKAGCWYDIGEAKVRDKVGHSLRDQVTAINRGQIPMPGAPGSEEDDVNRIDLSSSEENQKEHVAEQQQEIRFPPQRSKIAAIEFRNPARRVSSFAAEHVKRASDDDVIMIDNSSAALDVNAKLLAELCQAEDAAEDISSPPHNISEDAEFSEEDAEISESDAEEIISQLPPDSSHEAAADDDDDDTETSGHPRPRSAVAAHEVENLARLRSSWIAGDYASAPAEGISTAELECRRSSSWGFLFEGPTLDELIEMDIAEETESKSHSDHSTVGAAPGMVVQHMQGVEEYIALSILVCDATS